MRPPYLNIDGYPSRTYSLTCTDQAEPLPSDAFVFEGQYAYAALISCESGDVRIAFGDTIAVQADQHGHVLSSYFNTLLFISGSKAVRTLTFCNALAGQQFDGIIHITLFFERQ